MNKKRLRGIEQATLKAQEILSAASKWTDEKPRGRDLQLRREWVAYLDGEPIPLEAEHPDGAAERALRATGQPTALGKYLARRGISLRDFVARLVVGTGRRLSSSAIGAYVLRQHVPQPEVAKDIAKLTRGEVPADWRS